MGAVLFWSVVALFSVSALAVIVGSCIKEMGDQNPEWANEIPDGWTPSKVRLVSSRAK